MKLYPTLAIAFISIYLQSSCEPSSKSDQNNDQPITVEVDNAPKQSSAETNFIPITTNEQLLAASLLAAPKEGRDSCKVIGFNMQGEFITFREGSNEFIVLTDDPKKEGFNAACYHKSLEAFMARGRELKAQGKNRDEIFAIRGEEIKAGKLKMGEAGSTLHLYYGEHSNYDSETNKVEGARYRYVVYLPYATPESTGLPIQPHASNHPWIMDPGTHRAHIMITPKE